MPRSSHIKSQKSKTQWKPIIWLWCHKILLMWRRLLTSQDIFERQEAHTSKKPKKKAHLAVDVTWYAFNPDWRHEALKTKQQSSRYHTAKQLAVTIKPVRLLMSQDTFDLPRGSLLSSRRYLAKRVRLHFHHDATMAKQTTTVTAP